MATDPNLKLELTLKPGTIFLGDGGVEKWVSVVGGHCLTQDTVAAKPQLQSDGIYFDDGDNLEAPMSDELNWATGNFTVQLWAYSTVSTGSFISIGLNVSTEVGALVIINGLLSMASAFNSWAVYRLSAGGITVNSWAHYAIVGDNGIVRTYKDGVQQDSATQPNMYFSLSNKMYIGKYNVSNFFTGKMSDVQILGTCLYPGGTTFTPPPRSQCAWPTPPMPPLAVISAALLNQFDSGD